MAGSGAAGRKFHVVHCKRVATVHPPPIIHVHAQSKWFNEGEIAVAITKRSACPPPLIAPAPVVCKNDIVEKGSAPLRPGLY